MLFLWQSFYHRSRASVMLRGDIANCFDAVSNFQGTPIPADETDTEKLKMRADCSRAGRAGACVTRSAKPGGAIINMEEETR